MLHQGLDIDFKDLSYSVDLGFRKGKKEILHKINGRFRRGNLIGILGPSGSGKTTLLNVLSGYVTGNTGKILINGQKDFEKLKKSSCYITQECSLQTLLSVEENMMIAADLKLGNKVSKKIKLNIIEEKLNILGLSHVQTTRTSELSGGEKKRLAIALEIINNPSVMFLDEPTTGLDSLSCYQCVQYLKELSMKGKTIVCTIHQPSATMFQMFDEIYVMESGSCLYQGETGELLPCLEEEECPCPLFNNPADYVIELATGDYGEEVITKLKKKFIKPLNSDVAIREAKQYGTNIYSSANKKIPNWYKLKVLVRREFIKATRNPTLTYLRLITSITNSLALSSIFWKVGSDGSKVLFNYNAILGFVLHLMMPSLMLTILTFPSEIKTLKAEYFNRWYSIKLYYASISIIDMPISIIYCLVSNIIVYKLTDQPMEFFRFAMFAFLGFLVCIVAQSLGLLVGALFDVINGTFLGSAISAPMLIFGGFGITANDLPSYLRWLCYCSYLGYGVEGMVGAVNGYNREKLPCNADYCHYRYTSKFLQEMGIHGERFWTDVGVLVAMFLILRVLVYVSLKKKVNCSL